MEGLRNPSAAHRVDADAVTNNQQIVVTAEEQLVLRQLDLLRMQEELLKKEEELLLEAANLGETQPLSAPGAPRVAGGYKRPHPLLPLNKSLDADEWEIDENLLPEEQALLEQLGALPFHPAGHRRSASRNAHEGASADAALPQAPVSLGLEGVEQRLVERRMVQASKTFLLVHRVVEQEETRTPSAQLLPTLPLALQHLFNSVAVSEDLLPDVSLRRHVAAPPSSGSRIKCPSSTAQGMPLDKHVVHSAPRARGTGTAPAHRKYGVGPKRGERVRKQLVMCAIKGTKFEFWKSHKVVDLIGDEQEEIAAPARPYRGCIELTAASRVEVDRIGYCMKVHVVYLSSDKNDAVTDTHTFLQAPEDMEPRSDLSAVAQQLNEAIASLRSDSGRMVEFNSDPVKPWLKSKKTAPPLWEGPLQPPGFEDAELLDGYIPHFLADDSGLSRQLQPENAAFAAQFDRRKHQLWAALHKLKQTQPGSQEATLTVQQLLQRQGGAAAVGGGGGSRSSGEGGGGGDDLLITDGGGGFGGKAVSEEDVVGGVSGMAVVERKVEALDFSQYREVGDAAEVWDVEFAHGTLALRHTLNGMTLLMSTASADVVCALVTAGGDEFLWAEAAGLSERQLSGREREVVLTFASRYIAAAATHVEEGAPVALSRGWKVQHAWQDVHTYGNWSLQAPSDVRCVALNSLDLGAGVHLLANGFVILGRSRALLHLMTRQGPVGPIIVPSAQAVQVFVDEEKDRADAPHNLCAWRPLAQLNTTDIQQLKQEQSLVAVGMSMPPINLTVAGQPPFAWTVVPRLPSGIHIKVVDHHSAQLLGVPKENTSSSQYTITARNHLGTSETIVNIGVMTAPSLLSYGVSEIVLKPAQPVRYAVTYLEGSDPKNFKCDKLLPRGLRLHSQTGTISGTMGHDPDFPIMAEVGVKIYCANSVGSCTTHLIFSNGPRSTLSRGSVQVAEKSKKLKKAGAAQGQDEAEKKGKEMLYQATQIPIDLRRGLPPDEQQIDLSDAT